MESATRRREIHRSLNRGIDDFQRARQLVQDAIIAAIEACLDLELAI